MRITALPSPGLLANGFSLRMEAAKAISAVEITAGRTPGGKTTTGASLSTFFTACASALSALGDLTAPTVVSAIAATGVVTVTFTEALETSVVPAAAAFVFTPARTVTAVSVVGSTVLVTATGVIATDSLTYTKPAVNGVRDLAGNQVATFTEVVA